jgi:hypothetical protein
MKKTVAIWLGIAITVAVLGVAAQPPNPPAAPSRGYVEIPVQRIGTVDLNPPVCVDACDPSHHPLQPNQTNDVNLEVSSLPSGATILGVWVHASDVVDNMRLIQHVQAFKQDDRHVILRVRTSPSRQLNIRFNMTVLYSVTETKRFEVKRS